MAGSLPLLPAISLLLLFRCGSTALTPQLDAQASCTNRPDRQLIRELEDAKLKVDRLESILEESIQLLHSKILSIGESEKLIEEMSRDIDYLQSALVSLKGDSSREDERLNVLEAEVRLLWEASRKNNFELHTLETKAQDTEARLEVVTSQVEKMADIVAEQWIQIQQLEQALQITEFIKNLLSNHLETSRLMVDPYLSDKGFPLSSYLSRALHQLAKTFSAAQHYHHQLQGYIKQEMERNEFTAAFANREVVFFVRVSRFGLPQTSWRSKCPYHQPPPLILAKGVEEARWGEEEKRDYVRKRLRRKRLGSDVHPFIPILVPNLFLLSLLLWNPFPSDES
ncbi:hypothetical protein RJ640_030051 [Escallonia rubra]|uniref:Uncharacterized protein n=1 Tax=Escallonia rubra TaxID=112253 RepID=A0AA88RZS9_9ASTE|nr:hypothetical protein RJ640_030051 [Escallonia rubra]